MSVATTVSHDFDSREPELIHQYLAAAYGVRGLRMDSGGLDYRLSHRRLCAGPFSVDRSALSADLRVSVDGSESVVVCESTTSSVNRVCDGEEGCFGPGDVFLAAGPGRPYRARWRPGETLVVQLDPRLCAQVASPAPGQRPAQVRFTGLAPASAALADHWRATAHYVRLAVLTNPEASRHPLVLGAAARTLATAALAVFPNTALTDPTRQDRRDTVLPAVRRAVAFMEEHAGRDINPADVAAPRRCPSGRCNWRSGGTWTPRRWPTCGGSGWNGHTRTCGCPTHGGRR
ncbi:hypothetical protein ACIA5A_28160 [Micromonospora sp. NPDC051300]|uniref:hypothetical protein n=1 Tax=Micromonospora sp. NPDC051300 TaxID=3364286 RepID=UPI00379402BF